MSQCFASSIGFSNFLGSLAKHITVKTSRVQFLLNGYWLKERGFCWQGTILQAVIELCQPVEQQSLYICSVAWLPNDCDQMTKRVRLCPGSSRTFFLVESLLYQEDSLPTYFCCSIT